MESAADRFGGGAIAAALSFIRSHPLKIIVASILILIPCYWHQHLEACDLASHTYNAWLASLVQRGQAPGLQLQMQWNNVLFDYALSWLIPLVGFGTAEKLAVSMAVLVFFWGSFALVAAAAQRPPWLAAPCIAMLTYGWVFNMGFLNLYVAAGLCFCVLALIWRGRGRELALVLPLLGLIWLCHMLAFAWAIALGTYIYVARRVSPVWHSALAGGALIVYFSARYYVIHHYRLSDRMWNESWLAGAEQLHLYSGSYFWLALAVLVVSLLSVVATLVHDFSATVPKIAVPLGVYLVIAIAVYFAPDGVWLPKYGAPLGLVPDRVSLIAAVFGCCTLAACGFTRTRCVIYACLALAFFGLLYRDTGIVNRMEINVERLISDLPENSRVVGTLKWPRSHIGVGHIVDRACIERCFSYANYEPASRQFRVRALPGNRFAAADFEASVALQAGTYEVSFWEIPMYQIYHCGANLTDLCVRGLHAGETNGAGASRPVAPRALLAPAE